jgi:sugar/nucleoside kinase (ribokinase family)
MSPDDIKGPNGAGDAFAAGAVYGLHQGWDLDRIVELAHAAAASSMRHIGTTDAMMGWPDCLALAGEYGWRPSPG